MHTGVASAEGLYLDQRQVISGDCINLDAGQRLLINRTVQAAVFESDARMILTDGLAYDRARSASSPTWTASRRWASSTSATPTAWPTWCAPRST